MPHGPSSSITTPRTEPVGNVQRGIWREGSAAFLASMAYDYAGVGRLHEAASFAALADEHAREGGRG